MLRLRATVEISEKEPDAARPLSGTNTAMVMLEIDLHHIKNYNFFRDAVIPLQTVHAIVWGRGAR